MVLALQFWSFVVISLKNMLIRLLEFGIRDGFVEKYGTQELLMNYFNLNEEKIYKKIKKYF